MGVGAKIKALLSERNMTIKELSEKTGISINTLYSITKRDSSNVRLSTLEAIAKALDVKPEALMTFKQFEAKCDQAFAALQQQENELRKNLIALSNMLNVFGLSAVIEDILDLLKDPVNRNNFLYKPEQFQAIKHASNQAADPDQNTAEAADPDQSAKK